MVWNKTMNDIDYLMVWNRTMNDWLFNGLRIWLIDYLLLTTQLIDLDRMLTKLRRKQSTMPRLESKSKLFINLPWWWYKIIAPTCRLSVRSFVLLSDVDPYQFDAHPSKNTKILKSFFFPYKFLSSTKWYSCYLCRFLCVFC